MLVVRTHRPAPGRRFALLLFAIALGVAFQMLSPFYPARVSAQAGDPSARQIAFDRDGEIFKMNADGTGQTDLGPGYDPAWSPDAQKLAVTFAEDSETNNIYSMDADGSNRVALTDSGHDFGPAYSPDGSKLAFTSSRRVDASDTGERVYLMNADGTGQQKLFAAGPSGLNREMQPAWSPDGKRIAFIGEAVENGLSVTDVYVANTDGTGLARLTTFGNLDFANTLAWSPDGKVIAFTTRRDIHTISADGSGVLTNLTNSAASDDGQPSYTSDGSKIVYASNNFNDDTLDGIYVMNADGTAATFTGAQGEAPEWKPEPVAQPSPTPSPEPSPSPSPEPSPSPSPGPSPEPSPSPSPSPTPTPQADLSVLLTASPNQPTVGTNLTYTLVVKNNGPDKATGVGAFFTRPQGLDLVSATPAAGSCAQSQQSPATTACQLGDIASGSQVSVTFVTKPSAAGEVTAFASANSALDDPVQNNNTQSLKLAVAPPAPCVEEVTASVAQTIDRPGSQSRKQVRHTIYVRNTSGRALNGLVHFVFDGLPASVEGDKNTTFFRTRCAEPLGRKYATVGVGLNELVWQPGQVIKLEVDFFNPDREQINYSLRIYTGPGYP